jgi:hypothetical protein
LSRATTPFGLFEDEVLATANQGGNAFILDFHAARKKTARLNANTLDLRGIP